jgi:hypothetical protein
VPERYHIHTAPAPARFQLVGKYGTTDWREDCSRCKNCVKHRCLYDVYRKEGVHNRSQAAPVEPVFECKACLSCVQGCTKGLLSLALNPEFLALGDAYWKPDLLATLWNQSEAGRIPVSGAGYRGPFSGPGFDSMWTDMSEIVRPTRDGIHGREYISTSVDIGSKPKRLEFDRSGALLNPSSLIELQLPLILDAAPWGDPSDAVTEARVSAAASLKTLAVLPARKLGAVPPSHQRYVVPLFSAAEALAHGGSLGSVSMAEIADDPSALSAVAALRRQNPELLVAIRLPLGPGTAERVLELHAAGVSIIHLYADAHGREFDAARPRFIKDLSREIHGRLVERGVRDDVTLIESGGIALPEHMAKAIICGADLVGVEIPLLVALGCRVCSDEHHGAGASSGAPVGFPACRVNADDPAYAAQRMVNLMGAWHSQLIEVLGAMGIREVRRLRGEVGRAMFLEDLERDAFSDLQRVQEPAER